MESLLKRIKQENILLDVVDGKLKVYTNKTLTDSSLLAEIKKNKHHLINFLSDMKLGDSIDNIEQLPISSNLNKTGYHLSSSQKRLWILSQSEEARRAYNMFAIYQFEGKIDFQILNQSFQELINRHEILRTVFRKDDTEVKQYVKSKEEFQFSLQEFVIEQNEKSFQSQLHQQIELERDFIFDLEKGPLLRGGLIKQTDKKSFFCFVIHHIICDGWSINIIFDEIIKIYEALKEERELSLKELTFHYKDYSSWQQERLNKEGLISHKEFWKKNFSGEIPKLSNIEDYNRPTIKTFRGSSTRRELPIEVHHKFKTICNQRKASLFVGYATILNILLYKYSGHTDIIIGSPAAGRDHKNLRDQIGLYVSTFALRTKLDDNESFEILFDKIKRNILEIFKYQEYPFDNLLDDLQLSNNSNRNPLFDVMLVMENSIENKWLKSYKTKYFSIIPYGDYEKCTSKLDLLFSIDEEGDKPIVHLEYNNDIYSVNKANQLVKHFVQILKKVIDFPSLPIIEIDYLDRKEKKMLFRNSNPLDISYSDCNSIIELFGGQVKRFPEKTALVFREVRISYSELDIVSSELAIFLREKNNLKEGDSIAILLPKSHWQVISILATLKIGCIYVPIDLDNSQKRINHILKETNSKLTIDVEEIQKFEKENRLYEKSQEINTKLVSSACIMYTSGSTGLPKGVVVKQKGIISLVKNNSLVNLTENNSLISTSSFSFDAINFEYFGMLLNGGKLVICEKEELLVPQKLSQIIKNESIDTVWFTSGLLNQIIDFDISVFEGISTVLAGGDVLSVSQIQKLRKTYPVLEIINGYGPTENTTFSTMYSIGDLIPNNIPIGKPINNNCVYILDKKNQLVPNGVIGEICVGGDGLSKEYINRPNLTSEKFIPNPFTENTILYKTGDLGRWQFDGNIEFIGRKDGQIKLRGYRIELKEIEYILSSNESILSSVVLAHKIPSKKKRLAAYLICNKKINTVDLCDWLIDRLPHYMIPNRFVMVDNFPLTLNGKIDKEKLSLIDNSNYTINKDLEIKDNEVEKRIIQIWKEVLGVEKIELEDNFFDLGGNSIKLVTLRNLINKQFRLSVALIDLYKMFNVRMMSRGVEMQIHKKNSISVCEIEDTIGILNRTISNLNKINNGE